MAGVPTELAVMQQTTSDEMDAYERLLGDAMHGETTLFARQDVVEASWAVVDPLLANIAAPIEYAKGSWGPADADRLTESVGGWSNPK